MPPFWRQVWPPGMAADAVPDWVIWVLPERVQLRAMRAAGDRRATWDTTERLCPDAVARAGRLPEGALRLRAGDQWSFRREAASSGRRRRGLGRPTILGEPVPIAGSASCTPPARPRTPRQSASTWTRARRWQRCWRYAKTAWRSCAASWTAQRRRTGAGLRAPARARLPGGSTLGRPLPARGHDGGARASPLRGLAGSEAGTDAGHHAPTRHRYNARPASWSGYGLDGQDQQVQDPHFGELVTPAREFLPDRPHRRGVAVQVALVAAHQP